MIDPKATYGVAKGYVQSALIMMANPLRFRVPDDTSFYLAFHMLCGFAVELYLKAFLAHKGYSEERLRKADIRHDLRKLRDLCVSEGLSESGSASLVELLGTHHKTFEFRYMKPTSTYRAANLQAMFSAFSALDLAVDVAVGASVSHGKTPGGSWGFPADAPWRLPLG